MIRLVIAGLLAFVLPIFIGLGLYSIRDKHYAVTNVCNSTFYPDICGKE